MVKTNNGRPNIRIAPVETHSSGGIQCCWCRCFTCIHIEFMKTLPGAVKVAETIMSGLIQSLLINYGLRYSANIGSAFESSLTTSSACFFTSALLLGCYVISERSYNLIRASLFEMMFNAFACFFYLSSAFYLAFSTKMFLGVQYYITPGFDVYPAMTAAYMMSGVVGVIHGADAYFSFRHYRGSR
ncbi:GSCOCG00003376001-RA-CDS [Cotesia congregata]|uniref:Similar to sing: Protein singles bar (Drosophila melanogaster) n=1 Tax=Cotesia congregata TaxID=51543 RepID=A0A8J2HRU8_COTCN|nr:GSCOCG00003376001-RA-CDS [Cotesia congregata]CAG5108511.1 Similar to sing: Protein singles bar (Drosophila melanogaster) [Cotesia congregata]